MTLVFLLHIEHIHGLYYILYEIKIKPAHLSTHTHTHTHTHNYS